jgi:bifunctional non-homologous end joining protein LigD
VAETRTVAGREISLSSLDKVLYPATGFTKRDLIAYYERVAPVILPHLAGRPLTLGRWPAGVDGRGFGQMECRGHPVWMQTAPLVLRTGETRSYCVVNDLPSLLWVANLCTIELHPYLAPVERIDRPSVVVFDLDPEPPATTADCARVALALRDEVCGDAVVKTSGSAGIHLFVPLDSPRPYAETRASARDVAERLAARDPTIVARASRRDERAGTVLVDWMQNSERRSTIAPYSLRAADTPLVSTPVTWDEVEAAAGGLHALRFGPADAVERIARLGDLLAAAR